MTFDDLAADWLKGTPWLEAHTSGSTGTPKEVRLPRHFVEESAKRTNAFFGIGKDDVLYCPLAADYIAGKMMWIRAYMAGARFVAEAPSNRPMQQLPTDVKEIALLAVVPSQLKYIPEATNLPPIRAIIVGGAPTSIGAAKNFKFSGGVDACHIASLRIRPARDVNGEAVGIIHTDGDSRQRAEAGRGSLCTYLPQCNVRSGFGHAVGLKYLRAGWEWCIIRQ